MSSGAESTMEAGEKERSIPLLPQTLSQEKNALTLYHNLQTASLPAPADIPSAVHWDTNFNRTGILPTQLKQSQSLHAAQTHSQNKLLCREGIGTSAAKSLALRLVLHPANSGYPTCWLGITFPLRLILGTAISFSTGSSPSPRTSSAPGRICQRLSRIPLHQAAAQLQPSVASQIFFKQEPKQIKLMQSSQSQVLG